MVDSEQKISPPRATTGTVRRNPPRRARPTPLVDRNGARVTSSNLNHGDVVNFPLQDLMSMHVTEVDTQKELSEVSTVEPLQVFLRIRSISRAGKSNKSAGTKVNKTVWPRQKTAKANTEKKSNKNCIEVNDSHSVTITPPSVSSRMKSEVYNGFSHVFSGDSQQDEVYGKMVSPLVEEFLKGKSGLLAALGPSGSGKTHTVFGSTRDPGMVPRAIRHIFDQCLPLENANRRSIYLSMFEIYSERGRAEKLFDLSPDGGDIQLQQHGLKGLKEVLVADYAQADALIASGLLRRATATTNSNMQSSRSQCIINIRSTSGEIDAMGGLKLNEAVLTFVDLAGAERERKTGNQGDRLLESNFINKNSMVLSLCLRSLLEHQKNPKKPLNKHFQSSVLTKYLRDYLEGKKRMALILTVRPGEEDYLDTSYMLRQASPYMEIKFLNKEETNGNKRQPQTTVGGATDRSKRMKLTGPVASMETEGKITAADSSSRNPEASAVKTSTSKRNKPVKTRVNKSHVDAASTRRKEESTTDSNRDREQKNMKGFAKCIWSLLKECNQQLKVARSEIDSLREALSSERNSNSELQRELDNLKLSCLTQHHVSATTRSSSFNELVESGLDNADTNNANGNLELDELEITWSKDGGGDSTEDTGVVDTECNASGSLKLDGVHENQCYQGDDNSAVESELDSGVVNSDFSASGNIKLDQLENPCGANAVEEFKLSSGVMNSVSDASDDIKLGELDKSCLKDGGNPVQENSVEESMLVHGKELAESSKEQGSEKQTFDAAVVAVCEGSSSLVSASKTDKVAMCEGSSSNLVSVSETDEDSSILEVKPLKVVKPRRRLMPASSVLLRNYTSMDFTDDEGRGRRGERKLVEEESKMTALLRLLND